MRSGQAFALIANGQRVMVTCPANARPGQKIRFQLPIKLSSDEIQSIKLNYQKDGWVRCLSTDLTFHWIRSQGEVDGQLKDSRDLTWAFERSARKLRSSATVSSKSKVDHSLQLVPAKELSVYCRSCDQQRHVPCPRTLKVRSDAISAQRSLVSPADCKNSSALGRRAHKDQCAA